MFTALASSLITLVGRTTGVSWLQMEALRASEPALLAVWGVVLIALSSRLREKMRHRTRSSEHQVAERLEINSLAESA